MSFAKPDTGGESIAEAIDGTTGTSNIESVKFYDKYVRQRLAIRLSAQLRVPI